MSDLLRDLWYFAATSAELERGRMFRREILGEPLVLGRDEQGRSFALRDICPHRAVPLSAGRIVAEKGAQTVECPYHGWRFGVGDGVCKLIPSLVEGQPYEAGRIRVRHYPTHEANGIVLVFVAADARFADAPPPAPDFGLGDFVTPKFVIHRIFDASMDNAVVGLMDPAHVPYVHNQWWWRPPSAGRKLKEKRFVPRERGWAIERHKPASNSLAYRYLFGGDVTTEICFMLPGFRWEIVENERSRLFTLTCLTPENENSTRITQVTYWKHAPLLDVLKPILIPAGREFLDQDGRMVDLQNTGLKYGPSMLWIDDIDVQAKWYLKLKREWVKSREEGRAFVNPIEPTTLKWLS
ncbi:MAG: aromatic ring-hydroxylating dioxygenase subunit alpha [Hyphomonadaceae bacterium]|nr:aromatic ring-hydroxylating dioxygenase subunit alpha [Hyphomonadaceae bacterium]